MAKKKKSSDKKPATKSQIIATLAEKTGLGKKEVSAVFDALMEEINQSMSSRGAGVFTIPPGMIKVVRHKTKAKPEREGINPFTKEPTTFKAKPAATTVKVRPLKALKDLVAKKK